MAADSDRSSLWLQRIKSLRPDFEPFRYLLLGTASLACREARLAQVVLRADLCEAEDYWPGD